MWVELHLEGELQAVHAGGVTAALPWRQKQHGECDGGRERHAIHLVRFQRDQQGALYLSNNPNTSTGNRLSSLKSSFSITFIGKVKM